MQDKTLHFDISTTTIRGKTTSKFVERPRYGKYARGAEPVTYIYVHESGNMRMVHEQLWSAREIMARSASGQRSGAKPAVPNNVEAALKIATAHLVRYRGDGLDHSQRMVENDRKQSERIREAMKPRLV